jgi:hypothetical protein
LGYIFGRFFWKKMSGPSSLKQQFLKASFHSAVHAFCTIQKSTKAKKEKIVSERILLA